MTKSPRFIMMEKSIEIYAKTKGFTVNQNEDARDTVIHELVKNSIIHGEPYCPCSILRNEENICPCKFVDEDIKRLGCCKCRLFFKKKEVKE